MKNTLFIFILTLVVGLAAMYAAAFAHPPGYNYEISPRSINSYDSSGMVDPDGILRWMRANLQYANDDRETGDYWQTPEETLLRESGDCEDLSLLFMYLLKKELNMTSSLLLVRVDGRSQVGHAIVEAGGQWFELTTGNRIGYRGRFDVAYKLSYGRSLYSADKFNLWHPVNFSRS